METTPVNVHLADDSIRHPFQNFQRPLTRLTLSFQKPRSLPLHQQREVHAALAAVAAVATVLVSAFSHADV